jgi:hypothetical protein
MSIAKWSFASSRAWLAALPAIAIVGCFIWMLLPQASDAESRSAATPSELTRVTQNTSGTDAATQATLTSPVQPEVPGDADQAAVAAPPLGAPPETAAPAKPPIDGLKIASQSWRRGGLGSKALVTFTLRNANDYAVKDIEIACAFQRRDGSHMTDRRRIIHDTVNMKSRKQYAGMLVGFVSVNANRAKCTPVAASRI